MGFDGRKYISPQGFTQRARGDYEYSTLNVYLHDLAPDDFGERSSGNHTYYGDQTALYGYVNDTYRATPTLTINAGLRYEFTSVPTGERAQGLNSAASVAGLINIGVPQPTYTSFAPRFGINYAPDNKTSIRAGFGIAYDVLFDNLGTLSFPPQYSSTEDVGGTGFPAAGSANFLKNGGLPAGASGTFVYPSTPAGLASQKAATSAYVPNQVTPYAETYTLNIQRTFGTNYTAQIGYTGTRGIHLATQDQLNKQPKATFSNQLPTVANGGTTTLTTGSNTTLAALNALSNVTPAYKAAGFTSTITSYQPFSQSNYNGLLANLTRRFQNGLQMDLSYTWSKTMDDATAEVFATVLTPRRQQDSQCIACDYGRSALDRTHRISFEVLYDLPYYKHSSNFFLKNLVGNWEISPIYTYESPEYATVLSGVNSNLNGDSGTAIDRAFINPNGVKGTGTGSIPITNPALAGICDPTATSGNTAITFKASANGPSPACASDIVGYSAGSLNPTTLAFIPSNAYYVQGGLGTSPNSSRNTLPIRPIDNFDLSAFKRFTIYDHYSFEFGAEAFNVLNHPQYIPGTVDNVNATSFTATYGFQTVTSGAFNHPDKVFGNNARAMQLSAKINF
jgi:TonB dependent receptor